MSDVAFLFQQLRDVTEDVNIVWITWLSSENITWLFFRSLVTWVFVVFKYSGTALVLITNVYLVLFLGCVLLQLLFKHLEGVIFMIVDVALMW